MCSTVYDLLIGIPAGILTGLISGIWVTWHYRKKDIAREKESYINHLKTYIRTVRLYLTNISLYQKNEEKNIEELQLFLKNPPIYRNEYKLTEKEKIINQCFTNKRLDLIKNIDAYRNGEWAHPRFKDVKQDAQKQKETAKLNFKLKLTEWINLCDMWND